MNNSEKNWEDDFFLYNPDSELYGSGNVDYGHNLAEYIEGVKFISFIEDKNVVEKTRESLLEKSLNRVNGLAKRQDVSLGEKQRVLSQVRKWGCYTFNKSPWDMNKKQIDFFFTDVLNYLREKLGSADKS